MVERIIIVGAGRTADSLIQRLTRVAPVIVLDTATAALEELSAVEATVLPVSDEEDGETPPPVTGNRFPLQKRQADGTSRLVLEELRGKAGESVALIAATGRDRM